MQAGISAARRQDSTLQSVAWTQFWMIWLSLRIWNGSAVGLRCENTVEYDASQDSKYACLVAPLKHHCK